MAGMAAFQTQEKAGKKPVHLVNIEISQKDTYIDFLTIVNGTVKLDEIYYPGYTQEIIDSEPAKFDWELAEFIGQFSEVE